MKNLMRGIRNVVADAVGNWKHGYEVRQQVAAIHRERPDLVPMLEKLKENLEFNAMFDAGIDSDDDQFTRIGGTSRDFAPFQYERIVKISRGLYEKDLLYKRLNDVPMDAVAAAGMQFKSDNPRLEELWDDFWNKPITGFRNSFLGRDGLLKENLLSGELNLPLAPMFNGDLEYAYLEPLNIKDILKVPGNALVDDKIVMRNNVGGDGQVFNVLRPVGPVLFGEVFRHAINRPINAKRGKPILTALLDWTDLHEQAMWNELERWAALKAHLWHVKVKGDQKVADALEEKYKKEGGFNDPGQVRVTNENVEIDAVTPDLKATDGTAMAKMMRSFLVGGAGLQDFFVGFGGEVNVATAREMMKVVVWMLEYIQREAVKSLTTLFSYQVQTAIQQGRFTSEGRLSAVDANDKWQIVPNQVLKKEFVAEASSFQQGVNALAVAKQSGFIGDSTAVKQYTQLANEFGFECTQQEIEDDLEETEANAPEEPEVGEQGDLFQSRTAEQPSVNEMLKMAKPKRRKRKLAY